MIELGPIDVAIIDADSMIYEIACVCTNRTKNSKSLLAKIENTIKSIEASTAYVYIKGENNFRFKCTDDYKAHRKNNLTPEQRVALEELYEDALEYCIPSDGAEADDRCGSMARFCRDEGYSYVISHIDKDLNGLPGTHHNFRTNSFYYTTPEFSYTFMMKQFLTGDAADNIKGIWKMGPVGAGKLMDDVPVERLWDILVQTWQDKQPDTWEANLTKCINLIWIRDHEDDFRPMTFEELKDKLQWKKTMDTGLPLQTNQMELGASSTPCSDQPEDNTLEERT